jgi:hypothetical protein
MFPAPPTTEELVWHQILLRDINERIVEVLKHYYLELETDGDYQAEFICECSRAPCSETISLTVEEYEAVRSSPTVFVMLPGHEIPGVEETLLTNERFSLVEKTMFAELAVTSDPRAG